MIRTILLILALGFGLAGCGKKSSVPTEQYIYTSINDCADVGRLTL